ncbi:Mpo1 family 2-hydroxy fatty acid dioxygenase [Legionella bononiensis]|uniref:DUF962 domain-containing protein n=1 Tax=Legionella bononiensis TaxID=2793102 RepID=A0ABS1WFG4_9GAMM|nr:Mpo1-like protein [Legionella bononiensis]MBL7481550.1 DUF962 domain-containing protein [Legionella bononiensis]MBL7528097.1 DUF962 domain-containing protein [Legionella bononiensis]MBL7562573.1 DUF962 domain-containing protein [Legionella bononiensis]
MKSFVEQAQFYAEYHQNTMTRYTHMAGVPLIILSIMILLGFVKIIIPGVFGTNLACLTTLVVMIYYYRLHWQLALALTPIMLILLWLASWFNCYGPTKVGLWAFLITFVVGWGLQFYGHYIEGKQPAFMVNIGQAFIAPLYLTAELFFMAGYMKELKEQIYGTVEAETKQ